MSQNIQKHLDALNDLKSFLEKFRDELSNLQQQYIAQVRQMHNAGVPQQIVDRYQNEFWKPNDKNIQTLIEHLEDAVYPYIVKQITAEEKRLNQI